MTELYLHNNRISSVFELLGNKENDITYSIGWALSRSTVFINNILKEIIKNQDYGKVLSVRLQEYRKNGGFTDIQIETEKLIIIIEAKRGWTLPGDDQLKKYAKRIDDDDLNRQGILVAMSECSPDYAERNLKSAINGYPIRFIGWKQIVRLIDAGRPNGTNAEKRLLDQLRDYMEGLITMQNKHSNWVYVVSLSPNPEKWKDWSDISPIEIVEKKRRYFHPFGDGNWPNKPPNYIAFRYWGKLQSIHHIEKYEIVEEMHSHIPEIHEGEWAPYFLYHLGEPFRPAKDVSTGPRIRRANRVWVMLDTLFTSGTISDALTATELRKSQEEK